MMATQSDSDDYRQRRLGLQSLLPIPVVYNGWVQNLPGVWKNPLTPGQQNPIL